MTLNQARILSSIIVAMAYLVTLYHSDIVGSRMYIIGNSLAMPYMIQNKLWDMVALLSFFIVFGVPKAIGGY